MVCGDRLRTCMSSIILWRSGVMMDSSSCRDTWSISPRGRRYAPGATTRLVLESRHHVWVVFGKRFEIRDGRGDPYREAV